MSFCTHLEIQAGETPLLGLPRMPMKTRSVGQALSCFPSPEQNTGAPKRAPVLHLSLKARRFRRRTFSAPVSLSNTTDFAALLSRAAPAAYVPGRDGLVMACCIVVDGARLNLYYLGVVAGASISAACHKMGCSIS